MVNITGTLGQGQCNHCLKGELCGYQYSGYSVKKWQMQLWPMLSGVSLGCSSVSPDANPLDVHHPKVGGGGAMGRKGKHYSLAHINMT